MTQRRQKDPNDMQLVEDLSVLARRGSLTDVERRRFAMALTGSESLRYAHQLGRDFDAIEAVRRGDEALIERIAARARERFAHPRHVPRRSLVSRLLPWVGVASLLLVSAAAGATLWPYARMLIAPAPRSSASDTAVVAGPVKPPTMRGRSVVAEPSTRAELFPGPDDPVHPDVAAPSTPNPRPLQPTSGKGESARQPVSDKEDHELETPNTSAARLFGEANSLRRGGAIAAARAIYRQLQERYPTASEAVLSYAVVGRLDLQQGAAVDALQQFGRYLASAPAGPLAEEALHGQAEAYHQLNMEIEEARAWRELLQAYPNSLYGQAARKRLGESP